jgi:hypothetical protein
MASFILSVKTWSLSSVICFPISNKSHLIVRFKLGEEDAAAADAADQVEGAAATASSSLPLTGKKVLIDDTDDDDYDSDAERALADKAADFDINLYEEYSPSKEKNNGRLADLYKKQLNKENVNVVINNVMGAAGGTSRYQEPEEEEEEEVDDFKTTRNSED